MFPPLPRQPVSSPTRKGGTSALWWKTRTPMRHPSLITPHRHRTEWDRSASNTRPLHLRHSRPRSSRKCRRCAVLKVRLWRSVNPHPSPQKTFSLKQSNPCLKTQFNQIPTASCGPQPPTLDTVSPGKLTLLLLRSGLPSSCRSSSAVDALIVDPPDTPAYHWAGHSLPSFLN